VTIRPDAGSLLKVYSVIGLKPAISKGQIAIETNGCAS